MMFIVKFNRILAFVTCVKIYKTDKTLIPFYNEVYFHKKSQIYFTINTILLSWFKYKHIGF